MTSNEFVLWLKGFTEGVHEFNITPKQWDLLKDKLAEVKDEPTYSIPFGVPNTAPIQTLPFIQPSPSPTYPHRPYEVYCGDTGTGTTQSVITTTPGGGSITFATPQFVTTTANGYPSGSTISYTTNKKKIK